MYRREGQKVPGYNHRNKRPLKQWQAKNEERHLARWREEMRYKRRMAICAEKK